MKRIALSIHSEKHPEVIFLGYALSNEVTDGSLSFFSTVKFQPDEALEIKIDHSGEPVTYQVTMTRLHEQISSGRIMNAIPNEDHSFPARTFYRCFAKVNQKTGATVTPPIEELKTEEAAPAPAVEPIADQITDADQPQAA